VEYNSVNSNSHKITSTLLVELVN